MTTFPFLDSPLVIKSSTITEHSFFKIEEPVAYTTFLL